MAQFYYKFYITYWTGHPNQVIWASSYEAAYEKAVFKDEIYYIERDDMLGFEYWTPQGGRQVVDRYEEEY